MTGAGWNLLSSKYRRALAAIESSGFGGDHLDYLMNDTWVFDLAKKKWEQRHPKTAPPPGKLPT